MESKERYKLQDELRETIESGDIENVPPEKFKKWLIALATGAIPNDAVRHNAIILGLTVNHMRTEQVISRLEETIKSLNTANEKSQRAITYLTIIATVLAIIATAATVIQAMPILVNWWITR
jgi:hypothetical protein